MGIKDLILKFKNNGSKQHIQWRVDPVEGVDFILSTEALADMESLAINEPLFGMQMTQLRGLLEQGLAEQNANGFTVLSENVVEQEDFFFELFDMPTQYDGKYAADIRGNTAQAAFSLRVTLNLKDGTELPQYKLNGPFLQISEEEQFRISPAEYQALNAVEEHQSLSDDQKSEYENNWVIFQLQLAKKAGMHINLGHFDNLELLHPESVGVAVEEASNGDLILTPTFGAGIDIQDVQNRLGQFNEASGHAIFRVKNRFVLLDDKRLEASNEILTNRRIPKEHVAKFLKAPSAYLDSALIDLDTGFSLRAHGAERFAHRYFGDVEKSDIEWFSQAEKSTESFKNIVGTVDSDESLAEIEQKVSDARNKGADIIEHEGKQFDISDQGEVEQAFQSARGKLTNNNKGSKADTNEDDVSELDKAVVAIDTNDEGEQFSRVSDVAQLDITGQQYSRDNLKRTPFEHQDEGIRWLLAHYELSKNTDSQSGAILADDMGLGKTFMTLVSIAEWYGRCKKEASTLKPVLIVAPLSLLENWQAEVFETFHKSPFNEIIVLQAGADLKRFKISGAGRETQQEFGEGDLISDADQIRYSLKVGNHYDDRLDKPGRLVLTTYQTLRDFQFSLSRVNWSVAAFDEAQNLKNPNALSTIAAKALNADFKLLATGTPVENTLRDFWCLMDTAVPGLLGAWQTFRKEYIVPITKADMPTSREVKLEVGARLRSEVGQYMLRRTKEENLKGLPSKTLFTGVSDQSDQYLPELSATMKGGQLNVYDEVIAAVQNSSAEDKRQVVLPSLQKLKLISIHHELVGGKTLSDLSRELDKSASQSAKISSVLTLLEKIQNRGEKALIFATSKSVQAYIRALITQKFRVNVEIINGETKAVANKKGDETRKGIIDKFQSQAGFGVLIMSPVAAGVGLTVTGANNVIHLERHWNPAKEAQATDRVYRIGQQRDVNVYIPISKHPSLKSFDVHLNSLLGNKIDLSNAVVVPDIVEPELMDTIF